MADEKLIEAINRLATEIALLRQEMRSMNAGGWSQKPYSHGGMSGGTHIPSGMPKLR